MDDNEEEIKTPLEEDLKTPLENDLNDNCKKNPFFN